MIDFWKEVTVEEIALKVAMGPFGSDIKTDNFVPSGVPIIRGNNLTSGRFNASEFVFLTEKKADELANSGAFPGDVIFTHRGTLGQVGLIPKGFYERYIVSQSQMKLTCDPEIADSAFIYYFFKSPMGQYALLMNTSQTGVPAISRPLTSLRNIRLLLPPLSEQRAIAHILGTLDDKIELNRRMNQTLESMARALFKSWFIDFDPVRAKAEGRDTGLPSHIADLFPNLFVESELGEIPRDWKVRPLPEVIEVNPSRSLSKGSMAPYLAMANMPIQGHRALNWIDRPLGSGTKFKYGDTLLARITPCLENGKTAYVDFLDKGQVGWGSTEFIVFRPKSPFSPEYGYYLARSDELRNYAIQNMTGTSGRQRTPASCFDNYLLSMPPIVLVKKFGDFAKSVLEKVRSNSEESSILGTIRNSLLPKLIKGDIRVSIVERYL